MAGDARGLATRRVPNVSFFESKSLACQTCVFFWSLRPVPWRRSVDCARPLSVLPILIPFTFTNYDAASVDQYPSYEPFRVHYHELIESPVIGVGMGAAFSLEAMEAFGLSRTAEFWSTFLVYEQPTSSHLAMRLADVLHLRPSVCMQVACSLGLIRPTQYLLPMHATGRLRHKSTELSDRCYYPSFSLSVLLGLQARASLSTIESQISTNIFALFCNCDGSYIRKWSGLFLYEN